MIVEPVNMWLRRVPVPAVYGVGLLPPFVLFYMAATGALGIEPIEALEHELGALALKLLIFGLAITPLRRLLGLNLMRFRRAIGVLSFYYLSCHLLVWLVLDVQDPARIWADILKRPYITVGMLAFLLLMPLAATSNDWSVRRLGPAWRKLHRAVYGAAILAGLHFVMQAKGFQVEPLLYMATILGLLALRIRLRAVSGQRPAPRIQS